MLESGRHEQGLASKRAKGGREAVESQHGGGVPINLTRPEPTLTPPRASRSEDGSGGPAGEATRGAGRERSSPDVLGGDAHVKEFKAAELSGAWNPREPFQNLSDGLPPVAGVGQGHL